MTLVFTAVTSKHDVTLCKFDVNVKNRTAFTDSIDFFELEKVLLYSKFFEKSNVINPKVCKKKYLSWVYGVDNKYLSWVYGVDRKICHEGH